MRVTASTDIQHEGQETQARNVQQALEDIVTQVNGGLTFAENISCKIVSVTFANVNVEQAINHGLGRVPAGYFPILKSAATNIYLGDSARTSSVIYLKANQVATVSLIVF